jgi:hypothetical protein
VGADVMPLVWKWSAVPVAFLGLAAERTLVTEIARSVVFTVGFTIVQMLIKLPFSIYGTFYLEQRHGFNKTTKFTFVTDMIKSICLMVVFTPIIEGARQHICYFVHSNPLAVQSMGVMSQNTTFVTDMIKSICLMVVFAPIVEGARRHIFASRAQDFCVESLNPMLNPLSSP